MTIEYEHEELHGVRVFVLDVIACVVSEGRTMVQIPMAKEELSHDRVEVIAKYMQDFRAAIVSDNKGDVANGNLMVDLKHAIDLCTDLCLPDDRVEIFDATTIPGRSFLSEIAIELMKEYSVDCCGHTDWEKSYVFGCDVSDDATGEMLLKGQQIGVVDNPQQYFLPIEELVAMMFTFAGNDPQSLYDAITRSRDLYRIVVDTELREWVEAPALLGQCGSTGLTVNGVFTNAANEAQRKYEKAKAESEDQQPTG